MSHRITRWLAALACLAFILAGAPSAEAAKHKKGGWPSKKSHKPAKKKPSAPASGKSAAKPPADEEDEGEEETAAAPPSRKDSGDDEADAPAFKPKKVAKAEDEDEDDRDASSSGSGSDDDGEGTTIRKKAKKPIAEDDDGEGAPVAIEFAAGPRLIHRSFDFNDHISEFYPPMTVMGPSAYNLPAGPAPFVDAAIYPLAFASRGVLANIGLIGRYERLVGVSSVQKGAAAGGSTSTIGQQFEVGGRFRVPLGASELGVSGTYGTHIFKVGKDNGPSGSELPNLQYAFAGVGADGRVRVGPITIGAHVGTRFILNRPMRRDWASSQTTKVVEGGISLAYRITPMLEAVAGGDIIRYAFDFNPKPGDMFVAGGAVDQYLSGFLALRILISGG